MSGLKMNYDKTVAVWIGSKRNPNVKFIPELNFNWNPVTFWVLGVVFSTNVHEIVLINYENKLSEIKESCLTLGQEGTSPPLVRSQ